MRHCRGVRCTTICVLGVGEHGGGSLRRLEHLAAGAEEFSRLGGRSAEEAVFHRRREVSLVLNSCASVTSAYRHFFK